MENIINTPFDDIVSTFNGYTETKGQIEDAEGQVRTGAIYSNFSRSSVCEYVYVQQENEVAPPKYILATVRVYYKGGMLAEVRRLITR